MLKKAGQNAAQMKRMNRLRVLRLIRRCPVSRSDLAREMGLTSAAMSLIVGDMLQEGVLVETGRRASNGGRKAVLLELCPQYACAAALSLSRSETEVGLVDLRGHLLQRALVAGDPPPSRAAALDGIRRALRRTLASQEVRRSRYCGLGISAPGPVDVSSGMILNPPNFDLWHGVRMCEELRDTAGENIFLANNSQGLAIAEKNHGIGRQCSNFVLLVIDTGIGGGIVRGDELFAGWHGFGSEIGHTSINYNGPLCNCGLRGCVELYASTPAVLRRAQAVHPRLDSWKALVDLAHEGDAPCKRLIEDQARAVAAALVNSLNILEPEAVVLTGDVLYRGEMLRAAIQRHINQSAINRRLHRIPVHLSQVREHYGLMAAAGIITERFFHEGLNLAALH